MTMTETQLLAPETGRQQKLERGFKQNSAVHCLWSNDNQSHDAINVVIRSNARPSTEYGELVTREYWLCIAVM